MSDAVAVSVAKTVTGMIAAASSAGSLSQRFTPERSYADWDLQLELMDLLVLTGCDKLYVDVVTHTVQQSAKLSSRGTIQYVVPIDIAVRRKFGADKQNDDSGRIAIEEIDGLVLLVQELHLMFTKQRLAETNLAIWDAENGGTNILVNPDQKHLRENRQFTGLIRIFFRADAPLTTNH